jgi:uncharacterized protein (DUF2147 family)
MKHRMFAAAVGLLTAVVLVPGGQAQAATADPTGFWVKPDSERNAKIQIIRCGKGGALLCSSIIWLENPKDNRGRPLHDIRNENPSMRDRPILGLPLFTGMTRTGPATWTGKIYNPEDGNTYSATLTMVSHKQIMLKGCKAWLLCGERVWLRTSPPPQPKPVEEPQIEASAEPDAAQPAQATAAAIPSPTPNDLVEATSEPGAAEPQIAAAPAVELVTPAPPPDEHDMRPGYGFLSVSTGETTAEKLSGENVPSMFVMADPIEADEMTPPAAAPAKGAAPLPAPKPKAAPAPTHATVAPTPKPQPAPTQPVTDEVTAPPGDVDQQAALATDPETAESADEMQPPLTRRQMRALRRQERSMLPWLR